VNGITDPTEVYFKDGRWGWDGSVWVQTPQGDPTVYASSHDRGIARINVVQTAATAAWAYVWALRSATAGRTLYISRIWLQLWFNGTGAATEMIYVLCKGADCTAMSGGAAVTALLKRTAITNPDVDCRILDTGLTLTGVSLGGIFWRVAWSRLTHSATQAGVCSPQFVLDFGRQPIELSQNEVLVMQQAAASVVGDTIAGGVEFYG
jgi:hypothetical protein